MRGLPTFYTHSMRTSRDGYVALISAVIISAVLIMITSTLSLTGFWGRFDTLNNELKERSIALAEACGDTALLNIAANTAITTPLTVPIGVSSCVITSEQNNTPLSGEITIKTKATIQNIVTNIKIIAKSNNASVVSWEEIP